MIHFVNENSKRLVGRNNQPGTKALVLEYDITEQLDFQLISDNNQIVDVSGLSGLTLAVGLKQNRPSYELLALSHDYTIDNNVIKFALNTYTTNWLRDITKNNTEAHIEISQQSLEGKRVLLRDYCFVWPRTWVAGLSPEEIASNDYYTKTEVDELIEGPELSGYVTDEEFEEGMATKQNAITADAKLDYDLISGAPLIPAKTSELVNDSGFVTITTVDGEIESAISGKADKSEIPTEVSELTNDAGYQTAQDVANAISGKLDNPSGGTVGQVLKKTETGTEWADDSVFNPVNVKIQEKTLGQDTAYIVDFNGEQIQRYDEASYASGSISIQLANADAAPDGTAPTVELQIPVVSGVETISLPASVQIINMPDTLSGGTGITEGRAAVRNYVVHDLVFRNEKNYDGEWKTYVNHAYMFNETNANDLRDYFYIEALENGLSVSGTNLLYNSSQVVNPVISASLDKAEWTEYILSSGVDTLIADNMSKGDRLYVIADGYLSNFSPGQLIKTPEDSKVKVGGNVRSLFDSWLSSDILYPGTRIREMSLTTNSSIYEADLDCSCISSYTSFGLFAGASNLSSLTLDMPNSINYSFLLSGCSSLESLDGISFNENATTLASMCRGCTSLKAIPENFSFPRVIAALLMFGQCSGLTEIPNGFNIPLLSATNGASNMFAACTGITKIGDNVHVACEASSTNTDNTNLSKSIITSIGDNFKWFTNATFSGTWDASLGIRNVFPNATSVGSGWFVYDHHDGE